MGRPPGDPEDVRSGRLVQRAHPDLLAVIDELARREGLTRSLTVERILIGTLNRQYGARLDAIGRWKPVEEHEDEGHLVPARPFAVGERRQAEYDASQREILEESIARRSDKPIPMSDLRLPPRKPNKK